MSLLLLTVLCGWAVKQWAGEDLDDTSLWVAPLVAHLSLGLLLVNVLRRQKAILAVRIAFLVAWTVSLFLAWIIIVIMNFHFVW